MTSGFLEIFIIISEGAEDHHSQKLTFTFKCNIHELELLWEGIVVIKL